MGVSEGREEVGDKRSMEERGETGNRKKEGDGKREKRGEVEIGVGEGGGEGERTERGLGKGRRKEERKMGKKGIDGGRKRRSKLYSDVFPAGYSTFMEKEIFEQPESVINTMRGRVDFKNYKGNYCTTCISKSQVFQ